MVEWFKTLVSELGLWEVQMPDIASCGRVETLVSELGLWEVKMRGVVSCGRVV